MLPLPFSKAVAVAAAASLIVLAFVAAPLAGAEAEGSAPASPQQWHRHTIEFVGPPLTESGAENPFTDFRLDVTFRHAGAQWVVPGHWAADGDAADSSADSGRVWRVHFAPEAVGAWSWEASFRVGPGVAVSPDAAAGRPHEAIDGARGSFEVVASTAAAPDLRSRGRLVAGPDRYPITLGDGRVFLKAGADSPENFLAYSGFDGGFASDGEKDELVKDWQPHVRDWRPGDPAWGPGGERGRGIVGAVNYLASRGLNSVSMLTFNVGGDDRNVFPHVESDRFDRFDVSRLDQWARVLEHANARGLLVHLKLQETENETLLDGGDLGPQRRLYYREMLSRFGHLPGLTWNLGEENGQWGNRRNTPTWQTTEQRLAMAGWFRDHNPYGHLVVLHNGADPDDVMGPGTGLTGWSLQTHREDFSRVHPATLRILRAAEAAGQVWHVSCDEPGDHRHAALPDAEDPHHDNARMNALWGNLLAGGWGVEWYYGYQHPHSDLTLQDHRSREKLYDQSAVALRFFALANLDLAALDSRDEALVGAGGHVLGAPGRAWVVQLRDAAKARTDGATIDLGPSSGAMQAHWYDPRAGGELLPAGRLAGPGAVAVPAPPAGHAGDAVLLLRPE